jgi:16S rRNA (cytosine967-C5)-methyltransferase
LAIAIDRAVVVRWSLLQGLLERRLKAPWTKQHPELQAILLAGAAQLLLLSRLPDHAVLNEAVEAAKASSRPRAAGMVNAVLRAIARLREERLEQADGTDPLHILHADGSGWLLNEARPGADALSLLASQCGMHVSVLERWASTDGQAIAHERALHSIVEPPVIMHGQDVPGIAHQDEGFRVLDPGANIGEVLQQYPDARVQDPASARAVQATAGLRPQVIIDPCAGRGTKSRQLALLHPDALVVGADTHPDRAKTLEQVAETIDNLQAVAFRDLGTTRHAGTADLLLLDVPCTNSAVLPRRPEARHRLDRPTRRTMREKQRQIAANTMALLAPGGHLLWSTCSIDPEENQQQVQWLCQYHPLKVVAEHQQEGTGLPGEGPEGYRDGAYHALLQRAGR